MVAIVIAFILGGGYTYWSTGSLEPIEKTDREYIVSYRLLHASTASDKEILAIRDKETIDKASWKLTNDLLEEAAKEKGVNYSRHWAQKQIDQMNFHEEYFKGNVSAKEYIEKRY